MRIAIVGGTGYVGFCTGLGFASKRHDVVLIDLNAKKLAGVREGRCPVYEPGAAEILRKVLDQGNLTTATIIPEADIILLAVGTPSLPDGGINVTQIKKVSETIGSTIKTWNTSPVIVVKSTVVPGTTETVVKPIVESTSGKHAGTDFGLVMNPEFLREGVALKDFLNPDRIVIGEYDKRSGDLVATLYKDFPGTLMRTSLAAAEMIKYANNAFLATKISFINEIGNLCKRLGIDIDEVAKGIALDKRIAPHFLQSGVGYGGSCFPKDVAALASLAKQNGYEPKLLNEVMALNKRQRRLLLDRLGPMKGKRVAVLGLAFKPNTDDVRESPAIDIIGDLVNQGASVVAYDPQAMITMKQVFPNILYAQTAKEALQTADACVVLTDWNEFKELTIEDFTQMHGTQIIEGRRILKPEINADGLCW
ncbi:MAG: UDP-glucose/GDP-mannose dehydrogenase family protein [Nanoarchaeota archaeon]|nr:UDP-glucose/GDP-mannose dehydrogenase family protein [Nanoarchaeota archaeon]